MSRTAAAERPAAAIHRPIGPLLVIEISTPARPPATQDTWWTVSDTAKAEVRTSSGISR